jgi:enoyl-CoA hydratase/carnithine racemase
MDFGPFSVSVDSNGVAVVVFDRPPVNAVSLDVYEALGEMASAIEDSPEIRVVIIVAPPTARAWCGGADLHDFVDMDKSKRKDRYDFINASLPRFANISRPVIAAINAHTVGVGVILAGLCDIRIAADAATFSCPEIDFGLIAGSAGLLSYLKMPEGFLRELLYTGRRFTASEMRGIGFLNYVVPRDEVLSKSLEVANLISKKSLPVLRERKRVLLEIEGMSWHESYLLAQSASGDLVENRDSSEGVAAFLEDREPTLHDE